MSASNNFGDGSNRWIDGFRETVNNPVDRITNPYDTVAGAADAAALNFDEGIGGIVSLVDDEPGNTAGPGQQPAGSPGNQGALLGILAAVVVLAVLAYLLRPFVSVLAEVVG